MKVSRETQSSAAWEMGEFGKQSECQLPVRYKYSTGKLAWVPPSLQRLGGGS